MIKTVNVKPVLPIMALRTPILGEVLNCKMSDGDILQCIYSRAFVDEILEDGTLVRLNLTNYNKDNSHLMKTKVVKKEQPVVKEEFKVEPVVEATLETNMESGKFEVKYTDENLSEIVEDSVVKTETKVQHVEEIIEPKVEQTEVPVVEEHQRDNNKKNKNKRR